MVEPFSTGRLSVCVITLNEEKNLRRCISSVSELADQIVVVDSFSQDRTREIASGMGAEVYRQEFLGYVRQKQLALEKASGEWVLSLDADEWLDLQARKEVDRLLRGPAEPGVDGYELNRRPFYFGKWIRHGGWPSEWKLRLVRRDRAHWAGGDLHDRLVVPGRTLRLRGKLLHYPYRTLSSHVTTLDHWTGLIAQRNEPLSRSRILFGVLLEPPLVFLQKFILQGGILDGLPGFIVSAQQSYYFFLRYAKIWESRHFAAGDDPPDPHA